MPLILLTLNNAQRRHLNFIIAPLGSAALVRPRRHRISAHHIGHNRQREVKMVRIGGSSSHTSTTPYICHTPHRSQATRSKGGRIACIGPYRPLLYCYTCHLITGTRLVVKLLSTTTRRSRAISQKESGTGGSTSSSLIDTSSLISFDIERWSFISASRLLHLHSARAHANYCLHNQQSTPPRTSTVPACAPEALTPQLSSTKSPRLKTLVLRTNPILTYTCFHSPGDASTEPSLPSQVTQHAPATPIGHTTGELSTQINNDLDPDPCWFEDKLMDGQVDDTLLCYFKMISHPRIGCDSVDLDSFWDPETFHTVDLWT
ncbi:hypothetical protein F5880DRAFT_1613562 [Lentinula raphanica]|nr:hypothetical protein F5880DRAFT_1613562 [Lentinula raphanica]